jgi:large subunit ribosomal protein L30
MPKKGTAGDGKGRRETAEKKAPARKRAPRTAKAKQPTVASAQSASAAPVARLRVKQVRSGIGHAETYRRTLVALGLRHHQHEITVSDTHSTRGMLRKVWHLVAVRPEEA